jgi:hypothetical protein
MVSEKIEVDECKPLFSGKKWDLKAAEVRNPSAGGNGGGQHGRNGNGGAMVGRCKLPPG